MSNLVVKNYYIVRGEKDNPIFSDELALVIVEEETDFTKEAGWAAKMMGQVIGGPYPIRNTAEIALYGILQSCPGLKTPEKEISGDGWLLTEEDIDQNRENMMKLLPDELKWASFLDKPTKK